MALSVRENAALSALERFARAASSTAPREAARGRGPARRAGHQDASIETPVATLSGGNQQKVVLARAMLSRARAVLADEPTQGVDAGARVEIYRDPARGRRPGRPGRRRLLRRPRAGGPLRPRPRLLARRTSSASSTATTSPRNDDRRARSSPRRRTAARATGGAADRRRAPARARLRRFAKGDCARARSCRW